MVVSKDLMAEIIDTASRHKYNAEVRKIGSYKWMEIRDPRKVHVFDVTIKDNKVYQIKHLGRPNAKACGV